MKHLIVFVSCIFSLHIQAKLDYELVKDDLGIVWGMVFEGDEIILTERSGKIKKLNLKTKVVTELKGAPKVYSRGQGGLLDIKKHPKFSENNMLYFSYSKKQGEFSTTALARGILKGNRVTKLEDIFVAKGKSDTRRHYGSRITFDEQGFLYLSIGDRGERDNAQNLSNHFGKVLRMNDDGTAAKGNPFQGKKEVMAEIWSYGHRNPQGLFYDFESSTLYEMEHGPRGGDEINIIGKGKNYGWPVISYGSEYWGPISVGEGEKKKGMEQPLIYYVPSIAPCGLTLYRGNKYPELKDKLISGALKLTHLNVVDLKGNETARLFGDKNLRIRTVATAPDETLYFSTDGGKIFKVVTTK